MAGSQGTWATEGPRGLVGAGGDLGPAGQMEVFLNKVISLSSSDRCVN